MCAGSFGNNRRIKTHFLWLKSKMTMCESFVPLRVDRCCVISAGSAQSSPAFCGVNAHSEEPSDHLELLLPPKAQSLDAPNLLFFLVCFFLRPTLVNRLNPEDLALQRRYPLPCIQLIGSNVRPLPYFVCC